MFTWVGDVLIFPQDPLGRHGPNLDTFLRFPPEGCAEAHWRLLAVVQKFDVRSVQISSKMNINYFELLCFQYLMYWNWCFCRSCVRIFLCMYAHEHACAWTDTQTDTHTQWTPGVMPNFFHFFTVVCDILMVTGNQYTVTIWNVQKLLQCQDFHDQIKYIWEERLLQQYCTELAKHFHPFPNNLIMLLGHF
jgi:hypothetical protein